MKRMEKYWNLIEGVSLGIAGLVISLLGWVDDSPKSILIALSIAALVASVALLVFQRSRDKGPTPTE